MNNPQLKKRVMAMLVSSTVVAGVVTAPSASASVYDTISDSIGRIGQTAQSYLAVNGYEPLPQDAIRAYDKQVQQNKVDNTINVLGTEWGSGWCIDWGNQNPWDPRNAGYEVRKLTGASGHYGSGLGISPDIQTAAINVTKSLMKDYQAYEKGNWGKKDIIVVKTNILRALLSNNLSTLNQAREIFLYNDGALFRELTGFEVKRGEGLYSVGGVYLAKNEAAFSRVKANVKNGEYVTVLVPKNYDFEKTKKGNSQYQRLITIIQPGLEFEGNPPKEPWTGTETVETKTVYSTPPAVPTTVTETLPPRTEVTTIPGKPQVITETVTLPPAVETTTKTLPPQTTVVKTTVPGREVTKTVTPPPLTRTVTTTVNGTPSTYTTTVTQPATVTTETVPGSTTQVTKTVTETPVVTTKPGRTVVETKTVTPVATTEVTKPATTETVTHFVTPERVPVSTTTVQVKENYYYEKYYENLRETHEYFYFAGFSKDEKSKVIELPGNVKGSWSFDITKGEDIVIVERTEDGKLRITPRDDFEGEGIVEILITDEDGNQHVFSVKVTNTVNVDTSTNVKVNNFFYTIDPSSNRRVQIIEKNPGDKATWVFVDANGNRFEPKPGTIEVVESNDKVTVEVKDPSFRGDVVVRVTEKNNNVRENIVTVENKTTQTNYQQEILNTSVAKVERRGGDYTITEGKEKVDIVVEGDNYVIKPKPGTTGTVKIVFTDKDGIEYKYTLTIRPDESQPFLRSDGIAYDDTFEIDFKDGWRFEVRSGGNIADVKPVEGKNVWEVTPKDPVGGVVVIDIFDGDVKIGEWTVRIAPATDLSEVKKEDRKRTIIDRSKVDIYRGLEGDEKLGLKGNRLVLTEGKDLLDLDKSKMPDTGRWELRFKPGAEGTVRVVESQPILVDKQGNQGDIYQVEEWKDVTEFIYEVKPSKPRDFEYDISADNELTFYGTKLNVTKGAEMLAEEPKKDAGELRLDLKRDAKGELVVENSNEDGFVFERYLINVTEGSESAIKPVEGTFTTGDSARIPVAGEDNWKVVKGDDLVEVTRGNDGFATVKSTGKAGDVVIEVSDKRGKWAEYRLKITDRVAREYSYQISTDTEFRATLANQKNTFKVVAGAENFENPDINNGQWILKPKSDKAGTTGTVVEFDQNLNEINRYNLTIVQGRTVRIAEQRRAVQEGGWIDFPYAQNGGDFTIVSDNADLVKAEHTTNEKGEKVYRLTPKKGTAGNTIRIEERNTGGELVRIGFVSIVPNGAITDEGATVATNTDLGRAVIENNTTNGSVNINFPKGVADFVITDGADKVDVESTDRGGKLTPKPGVTGEQKVRIILLDDKGAQAYSPQDITVNVKNVSSNTNQGSSEDAGKCIGALAGALSPLLLLIPIGILSQVQIAGLEGISAQINAAIKEANDYVQRGLGIYDHDRAQRAAEVQGAFNIQMVNPEFIGLAAGSLGIITAGLLIADGVLRACGAGEYTSSYQIGKAKDNETLMKGSSGEIPVEKSAQKSETETKTESKSETSVTVKTDKDGKTTTETVKTNS